MKKNMPVAASLICAILLVWMLSELFTTALSEAIDFGYPGFMTSAEGWENKVTSEDMPGSGISGINYFSFSEVKQRENVKISLAEGLLYPIDACWYLVGYVGNIPVKTSRIVNGKTDTYNVWIALWIQRILLSILFFFLFRRGCRKVLSVLPILLLAGILLLGVTPTYSDMVLVFCGLLTIRLVDVLSIQRQSKILLRKLLPVYGGMLLLVLLMPVMFPTHILPVTLSTRGKTWIDESWTSFRNNLNHKFEDGMKQGEEEKEGDRKEKDQIEDESFVVEEKVIQDHSEIEEDFSFEEPISETVAEAEIQSLEMPALGLTGNESPDSVFDTDNQERGRIDLAGNLAPSGDTIAIATVEQKPSDTVYIRLFHAEDYSENRWETFHMRDEKETEVVWYLKEQAYLEPQEIGSIQVEPFGKVKNAVINQRIDFPHSYLNAHCRKITEQEKETVKQLFPRLVYASATDLEEMTSQKIHEMATRIAQNLSDTASYSLTPGPVPGGKEFLTWFLTESKNGYCVHFATAGVLLLRSQGYYARYAEGYTIPQSAWKQQKDGSYQAEIHGTNAHAWAECYTVDGLWEPIEVTPAWNGEIILPEEPSPLMRTIISMLKTAGKMLLIVILVGMVLAAFWYGVLVLEYRLINTKDRGKAVKHMAQLMIFYLWLFRANPEARKKLSRPEALSVQEYAVNLKECIAGVRPQSQTWDCGKAAQLFASILYQALYGKALTESAWKKARAVYRKVCSKKRS